MTVHLVRPGLQSLPRPRRHVQRQHCLEPDLARRIACFGSFDEILFAVAEGSLDSASVPWRTAIEGTGQRHDGPLAFDVDLVIQREMSCRSS